MQISSSIVEVSPHQRRSNEDNSAHGIFVLSHVLELESDAVGSQRTFLESGEDFGLLLIGTVCVKMCGLIIVLLLRVTRP